MMQLRDCNISGYGLSVESLPTSAMNAARVGSIYYFSGRDCPNGHNAARYTKGGRCVICSRKDSARQSGKEYVEGGIRAAKNLARLKASQSGSTTYIPPTPCPRGHFLRFTASANCVECDAIARARRKEKAREARLKKEYGMSFHDRDLMLSKQKSSCAICKEPICKKSLHIDHCHTSGNVRGLLCQKCNQGLGLFRDNQEFLLSAVEYLKNDI